MRPSEILPQWIVRRRVPGAEPRVLLTFDDGPSEVSLGVLRMLQEANAKAIFFVIGERISRAPDALLAMTAAGHQIGNHTYFHHDRDVLGNQRPSSFRDFYCDVARCQREIVMRTGWPPRWFRPPGGRLNLNTLLAPRMQSLAIMNWQREIADWTFRTAAQGREGGSRLAEAVHPGDIVLLHDERPCVLDLLDVLLRRLTEYRLRLAIWFGCRPAHVMSGSPVLARPKHSRSSSIAGQGLVTVGGSPGHDPVRATRPSCL